jgi:hypothetical protein
MGKKTDAIVSRAQLRALKTRRRSGRQEIKCHWLGGGYVAFGVEHHVVEHGTWSVPRRSLSSSSGTRMAPRLEPELRLASLLIDVCPICMWV